MLVITTHLWLSFNTLDTLARSSWTAACCSLSWRLCPGPWLWFGLWLWTWAGTSRSSSRDTSESDGLLVYESAEPCKQDVQRVKHLEDFKNAKWKSKFRKKLQFKEGESRKVDKLSQSGPKREDRWCWMRFLKFLHRLVWKTTTWPINLYGRYFRPIQTLKTYRYLW